MTTNQYTHKVYSPNQSQGRYNGRTGPHAKIQHNHNAPFLQICQPHIRTTETQRQAETIGGSAQNQRPHCRRVHQ